MLVNSSKHSKNLIEYNILEIIKKNGKRAISYK